MLSCELPMNPDAFRSKTLLVAACLGFLSGCSMSTEPTNNEIITPQYERNPFEGDASAAEEGRVSYETSCVSCHGPTGGPGSSYKGDLRERKAVLSDEELYLKIANGGDGTAMPGFWGRLDEEEIWKIITYIRLEF